MTVPTILMFNHPHCQYVITVFQPVKCKKNQTAAGIAKWGYSLTTCGSSFVVACISRIRSYIYIFDCQWLNWNKKSQKDTHRNLIFRFPSCNGSMVGSHRKQHMQIGNKMCADWVGNVLSRGLESRLGVFGANWRNGNSWIFFLWVWSEAKVISATKNCFGFKHVNHLR